MKIQEMSEQQLRDTDVPWLKSLDELTSYIDALVNRKHDYGTCVYAISMSAVATFRYVASKLGCTGFQASCADLDFLRRTRNFKAGFMIIDYEKLLYPQYLDEEHFPDHVQLLERNKEHLAKLARKRLNEAKAEELPLHPAVKKRWEYIAGLVPEKKNKNGKEDQSK